eukprot:3802334-Prymnesium_polylepis.1
MSLSHMRERGPLRKRTVVREPTICSNPMTGQLLTRMIASCASISAPLGCFARMPEPPTTAQLRKRLVRLNRGSSALTVPGPTRVPGEECVQRQGGGVKVVKRKEKNQQGSLKRKRLGSNRESGLAFETRTATPRPDSHTRRPTDCVGGRQASCSRHRPVHASTSSYHPRGGRQDRSARRHLRGLASW